MANWSNYDDVLGQLRDAGLAVDVLNIGTTKPVRCKTVDGGREKKGWYWLHELTTQRGDLLIVGSCGAWQGNDNGHRKITLGKTDPLTNDQREALRRRLAEDRKRLEMERRREVERAGQVATTTWGKLQPEGESPYLARKGVGAHGLRFTTHGSAVVPLCDAGGKLYGLQFLRTAAQAEQARRPEKEFWPAGLAKRGHFHLIGHSPHWIVLVAEGYATAASLHEATGYPVAVAFDAGNLAPVAEALHRRYRRAKVLVCADDDAFGRCQHRDDQGNRCGARVVLALHPTECPACGNPHRCDNAGVVAASSTALAVQGAWLAPRFADEDGRRDQFMAKGRKLTDFNDLQHVEGLSAVRAQVEARLSELKWAAPQLRAVSSSTTGGGAAMLRVIEHASDLLERYALVYGANGAVFDHANHCLLTLADVRNVCIRQDLYKAWMEHPDRSIVRQEEVGFDPACTDTAITCNLYGGWPTEPKAGKCERLLELLAYMCSGERNSRDLYDWVLKWVAYPIQHPGAKMKTTVVVHGPQGTGKNLFFESVMSIYGKYGRILDQDALTDKHNDWASRKLFLIADEVVAQAHRFEVKNKLKTLITGTWIRINPKHVAAYDEANHVNLCFLSNESMPVVLEEDDRRHCVIWTPPKKSREFYGELMREIEGGGIAALHDYLLHLDLGDFNPGTLPPVTAAKQELIDLAQDSPVEFVDALYRKDLHPLLPQPGLTTDWFQVYTRWCSTVGVKPASLKRFSNTLARKRDVHPFRKSALEGGSLSNPRSMLLWGLSAPEGVVESTWLGDELHAMRSRMNDYMGGMTR